MNRVHLGIGRIFTVSLIGTLMGACGGMAPPQGRLTTAESAVRAAEVGGAADVPKGKLHLALARDDIATARILMDEDDNEEADLMLQRAEVDARYALALANHEEAKEEANEVLAEIEELAKGEGR